MKWVHYSDNDQPIVMKSKKQSSETGLYHKPSGLWITPEDDEDSWKNWCLSEDFNLSGLKHVHDVVLADNAKLLHITSYNQLVDFDKRYGEPGPFIFTQHTMIDWSKVALEYDGILIYPYIQKARREIGWYYPWDCTSGCIWGKKAVASITPRVLEKQDV